MGDDAYQPKVPQTSKTKKLETRPDSEVEVMLLAEEEYMYTISLAKARNVPSVKRTVWATRHIKQFITHHIPETDRVWIDPKLNEKLFSTSRGKIPTKIRVKVIHFEDDLVEVSLPDEV